MTKIFRKRLVLAGAISVVALAMSAAPVQLGATGSLLDLKVAQADNNNSNNSNNPPGTATGGSGGGGSNDGSGNGSPGHSGPGNS